MALVCTRTKCCAAQTTIACACVIGAVSAVAYHCAFEASSQHVLRRNFQVRVAKDRVCTSCDVGRVCKSRFLARFVHTYVYFWFLPGAADFFRTFNKYFMSCQY